MSVQNYELERIQPNPFQTRDGEDAEHVKSVAISIAERGLLQVPSARLNPDGSGMIQIAFGHTRLAAFKLNRDTGNLGFETMPLNLVEMDDQQMFEAAVAENRERKDLTPIEEARAMLVYRDQFHKTSEEVGHLFGLSDSAVRGKLRLLDLPVEIQRMVGKTLTEGAAREVLTYESLPEVVKKHEAWRNGEYGILSKLVAKELENGTTQERLQEFISDAIESVGTSLDKKPWKHNEQLLDREGNKLRVCKGCELLITRDGKDLCLDSECFRNKTSAWKYIELKQASLISGIEVLEDDKVNYGDHTEFGYGNEVALKNIIKKRCENLRLQYNEYARNTAMVEGFPKVSIVCCKTTGHCTCLKAKERGVELTAGENGVTEADLKEARRQMKEQQKIDNELKAHLLEQAQISLSKALGGAQLAAWRKIISGMAYGEKWASAGTVEELFDMVAHRSVQNLIYGDNKTTLANLNRFLVECELPKLDIQIEHDAVEPQSQTSSVPGVRAEDALEDELATDLSSGSWDTIEDETVEVS